MCDLRYSYHNIFQAMSVLPKFGIEIKNWPQIIVLGHQNEGKSSLIESITQVNILPKCDGLCTRKPIYITLINNSTTRIIINNFETEDEVEAAAEISRLNLDKKYNRINCTIYSPHVYNCTIVDTVGLIHVSEQEDYLDPKKIKQDTIEYLKDKNNIFVLVSSAPSDLANSQMLQLIKKYKCADITLGVMTKIDGIEDRDKTTIIDILSGRNYKLGLGWIATKLRSDRDIKENVTIQQSLISEYEFCQNRFFSQYAYGVDEVRKVISAHQIQRVKSNIPSIIAEINDKIKVLKSSQNFLDKIINEADNGLAKKLSIMIEKLVGSSHERSQFENSLKIKLKEFLLEYMNKVFSYTDDYKLEDNLSSEYIDKNIYNYHVQKATIANELVNHNDMHDMLNSGLISPITINDQTLQLAYERESNFASLLPIFELKNDDPNNTKKLLWAKYLETYFSSLQNSNILQDKVYEITEQMLLSYINSENEDELSKHFTEYIIRNIGKTAFEDKMRYSISCLVNIEQRPYVNIYDVIKQIILITKSEYLDFNQFYTLRRLFNTPNCNKIKLVLYSDLWNRAYLITVIDRLALNCYRIVAVNLVNKMVENLVSMVIGLNKENSQKENDVITEKVSILTSIRDNLIEILNLNKDIIG